MRPNDGQCLVTVIHSEEFASFNLMEIRLKNDFWRGREHAGSSNGWDAWLLAVTSIMSSISSRSNDMTFLDGHIVRNQIRNGAVIQKTDGLDSTPFVVEEVLSASEHSALSDVQILKNTNDSKVGTSSWMTDKKNC